MVNKNLHEAVTEALCDDETVLLADGFDEAFIGLGRGATLKERVAIYDYSKCIDILMKDGMTGEEAEEYFEFNVIGSVVNRSMPIFMERLDTWED